MTVTVTAFHASACADISAFRACSHFGSREAALERATATKFVGRDLTLYEVQITFENPLRIYDDGGVHDAEYLVTAIREADRSALSRFSASAVLDLADSMGQEAATDSLAQAMAGRAKYDALVYENTTEDDGSLAWIMFRPEAVQIISSEPISVVASVPGL